MFSAWLGWYRSSQRAPHKEEEEENGHDKNFPVK